MIKAEDLDSVNEIHTNFLIRYSSSLGEHLPSFNSLHIVAFYFLPLSNGRAIIIFLVFIKIKN